VKSENIQRGDNDETIKRSITEYVKAHKAKYKWVKELQFVDIIPKSASGKRLRRVLRDIDRAERKKQGTRPRL
jgi:acyl-coenzyme A synthetase/AMP-(fatty) acid ligase